MGRLLRVSHQFNEPLESLGCRLRRAHIVVDRVLDLGPLLGLPSDDARILGIHTHNGHRGGHHFLKTGLVNREWPLLPVHANHRGTSLA